MNEAFWTIWHVMQFNLLEIIKNRLLCVIAQLAKNNSCSVTWHDSSGHIRQEGLPKRPLAGQLPILARHCLLMAFFFLALLVLPVLNIAWFRQNKIPILSVPDLSVNYYLVNLTILALQITNPSLSIISIILPEMQNTEIIHQCPLLLCKRMAGNMVVSSLYCNDCTITHTYLISRTKKY